MRAGVGLRVVTALLVVLGWLAVLRGLFVIPISPRPEVDLEAGPGFAVAIDVYLPAIGLTLLLVLLLAIGTLTSLSGSLVAAAAITGAFGLWVLTQDALLAYRPGLDDHLRWDLVLSGTALLFACLCLVASRAAAPDEVAAPAGQRR